MQPRREARLAAKARQRLPRLHERVLHQLARLHRLAGQPQTERVHPSRMQPVEPLERVDVAATRAVDERFVAGGLALGASGRDGSSPQAGPERVRSP